MRVLSIGMGTQSCALALMSARGDLPKLDAVIFADTQGEMPETYAYLYWLRYQMEGAGIPFHVVTSGSLYDDMSQPTPTSHNPTPPAHVLNADGTKGKILQYRCSYDYKRKIIDRKVKQLCGGRGAWKRASVEQWIGFSADETARMKQADTCRCGHKRTTQNGRSKSDVTLVHTTLGGCSKCSCAAFDPWQTNRWPLIELRMKRLATIQWFRDHGYPVPPRSACYFCPNSGNERWVDLKTRKPDLFAKAVLLDETIRAGGGFNARGNVPFEGQMFLHNSCTPLATADLRTARQITLDAGQGELFDPTVMGECSGEVCFT